MTGEPVIPIGRRAVYGTLERLGAFEADGIGPRSVDVWLPGGYHRSTKTRFPVIYMHDGQNLFEPDAAYIGIDWAIDEVATALIRSGRIRAPIVVAMHCTDDRLIEYGYNETGRAYLRWIVETLKPVIDARFRTLPDRTTTFTMGSSMGGLISFLALWYHPDVFGGAGCLSPAFTHHYAPGLVAAVRRSKTFPRHPVRIYIDNGGDDLDTALQPSVDAMLQALRARGFRRNRNLVSFRDRAAPHDETAWANRVWRPLEFLLGTH